jgi:hypothetical protein
MIPIFHCIETNIVIFFKRNTSHVYEKQQSRCFLPPPIEIFMYHLS